MTPISNAITPNADKLRTEIAVIGSGPGGAVAATMLAMVEFGASTDQFPARGHPRADSGAGFGAFPIGRERVTTVLAK